MARRLEAGEAESPAGSAITRKPGKFVPERRLGRELPALTG
jgi:hypothetical protein